MKKRHGDNIQVRFSENDCLIYEVCTEVFNHGKWAMKGEFELASYAQSSPLYDPTKRKVVGKF